MEYLQSTSEFNCKSTAPQQDDRLILDVAWDTMGKGRASLKPSHQIYWFAYWVHFLSFHLSSPHKAVPIIMSCHQLPLRRSNFHLLTALYGRLPGGFPGCCNSFVLFPLLSFRIQFHFNFSICFSFHVFFFNYNVLNFDLILNLMIYSNLIRF